MVLSSTELATARRCLIIFHKLIRNMNHNCVTSDSVKKRRYGTKPPKLQLLFQQRLQHHQGDISYLTGGPAPEHRNFREAEPEGSERDHGFEGNLKVVTI